MRTLRAGVICSRLFEPSCLSEVSALQSRHCYQRDQIAASGGIVLATLCHDDTLDSSEKYLK